MALVAASSPNAAVIALLGAVVGGLLTVCGDLGIRVFFERRRAEALRASLLIEAHELARLAAERARARQDGMPLRAPLPTLAWKGLIAAGGLERLSDPERTAFLSLYERVDEANYLATQAGLLFAIAQLTESEAAGGLEEEAHRLATVPYADVADAARAVVVAVGGH